MGSIHWGFYFLEVPYLFTAYTEGAFLHSFQLFKQVFRLIVKLRRMINVNNTDPVTTLNTISTGAARYTRPDMVAIQCMDYANS